MFKEFKEFAMKGNVIDLAVGVVIGGAFGKIVASFVSDMLMPLMGVVLGRVDFNNLYVVLAGPKGPFVSLAEAQQAGALTLNYGRFISSIFDFGYSDIGSCGVLYQDRAAGACVHCGASGRISCDMAGRSSPADTVY